MENTVRVLIADDHPLFREGMRGRLDRVADITVVGEASSGEEAVELARKLEPHVVLMDIKMPGLNGIEATREILRKSPRVGVLMLSICEGDGSVFATIHEGAKGYLLKDSGGWTASPSQPSRPPTPTPRGTSRTGGHRLGAREAAGPKGARTRRETRARPRRRWPLRARSREVRSLGLGYPSGRPGP
jgi:CheY-like chemotaxis protein